MNSATPEYGSTQDNVAKFSAYDETNQAMVESCAASRAVRPNFTEFFQPTPHIPIMLMNCEAGQVEVESSASPKVHQLNTTTTSQPPSRPPLLLLPTLITMPTIPPSNLLPPTPNLLHPSYLRVSQISSSSPNTHNPTFIKMASEEYDGAIGIDLGTFRFDFTYKVLSEQGSKR